MMSPAEKERIETLRLEPVSNVLTENTGRNSALSKLQAVSHRVNEISKRSISFSSPIIKQKGKPLFFPKTINIIQGKMGSHKSRMAEHIASTLLTSNMETPILGLTKSTSNPIVVVYIDTERNLTEQLPYTVQTIKQNAGFHRTEDISSFEFTSLLDIPRQDRLSTLKDYLESVRKKHKDHIFVIIDVMTDCILNFNDVQESMSLIDLMNQLINTYDITFLSVIHENPNSKDNKARGHIGTELANKATTVLSVSATKDEQNIYEVKHVKSRSTERYPHYYVRFNSLTKQLEFTNNIEPKWINQTKVPIGDLVNFLIDHSQTTPLTRKVLIAQICLQFSCSKRTAIDRLENLIDSERMKEFGYRFICEDVPGKTLNQKQFRIEKIGAQEGLFAQLPNPN